MAFGFLFTFPYFRFLGDLKGELMCLASHVLTDVTNKTISGLEEVKLYDAVHTPKLNS